jgi:anaerobic selenocysteine-containing dehydrogenase
MPVKDAPLQWGKSTVETACPLDCPDSCTLAVSVEKGRVVAIDGAHRNPTTSGFICAKVRGFEARVYSGDRLMYPAVRKGPKGSGELSRVTWDEAMQIIADRIQDVRGRWGGEAILPVYYGGSNGWITQDTADAELFRALGSSRLARTLCAAATGAAAQALYGRMPGVAYEDYPHARLIVIWGANPSASGIHLVPFIKAARARGAALVVVDPRRTPLARQADLHLAIRPGSDVAVALSVHRHLFEHGLADTAFLDAHTTGADRLRQQARPWTAERAAAVAGIDAADLRRFAEMYADASPALIRCGWGLERNRNGASAVMAVLALPAVAGKFGVRGGGYTLSNSAAWGVGSDRWLDTPEPQTRIVNMNQLGRALLELDGPPLQLIFVYNANPVATFPDQNRVVRGLERDDLFTVVFDQVLTDTARYADVVLPATTFLEGYDIAKGYGAYSLQIVKPVIDAVGESRPNVEVFGELGRRLGLDAAGAYESDAEALLRVVRSLPDSLGSTLAEDGLAEPPEGRTPVQFVDTFPRTEDRKVHLFPEELDRVAPAGLYACQPDPATTEHPLALISPASEKTISSTLGEARTRPASLYMHREDAAARGIADGDTVRVFNALGDVQCPVLVGEAIAPGTVSLPKGLWRRSTLNQSTANALAPDTLTDLGGGACFNDARVEVARVVTATFDDRAVGIWVARGAQAVH